MSQVIDHSTERQARALNTSLQARGILSDLQFDGDGWFLRLPLIVTALSSVPHADIVPALLVLAPGAQSITPQRDTLIWIGQLADFSTDGSDDGLTHIRFAWRQRSGFGETVESIADVLVPFVALLSLGAGGYLSTSTAAQNVGLASRSGVTDLTERRRTGRRRRNQGR